MSDGFHHLHARKRLYRKLEPYPHPTLWKRYLDYLMYGVAIIAPAAMLPQVVQLYANQDASGLALPTWIMFTGINTLWFLYAFVHRETPLAIASFAYACLDLIIVTGILLYA